jgi:hypothetical protein
MAADEAKLRAPAQTRFASLLAGAGLCAALSGCVGPGLEPPKDHSGNVPSAAPAAGSPGFGQPGRGGGMSPARPGAAGTGANPTAPETLKDAGPNADDAEADGGADDSGVDL